MTIGIVGLGLIGGSIAKAFASAKAFAGDKNHKVYGFDTDEAILGFAEVSGAINGVLRSSATSCEDTLSKCDTIFIALNPGDAVNWLKENAPNIAKDTLVIDCCGVKQSVCSECFPLAEKYGFIFVGGHPMAGSHKGGFKNSRADLFQGAYMILVPPVYDDPGLFGRLEETLKPLGFGHHTVTTAEKHDEMIAFSSQMAHVVSNAYIKSPTALGHKGYSAGSYKDLTRVARLNADMWGELFMANSESLIKELDGFIASVTEYKEALEAGDKDKLVKLLADGSRLKTEVDAE